MAARIGFKSTYAAQASNAVSASNFGVIPGGNHVGSRAEDEMKVVGKNRKAQQIDTEGRGELAKIWFDPYFPMIKILAGDKIVTHQEAASHGPVVNVSDGDVIGIK